jgi:hypothetical protein
MSGLAGASGGLKRRVSRKMTEVFADWLLIDTRGKSGSARGHPIRYSQAAALSSFRAYFCTYTTGYRPFRRTKRSKDETLFPASDELILREQVRVNRTWRYREQDSFSGFPS